MSWLGVSGCNGAPVEVVKTRPLPIQSGPALSRSVSCRDRCSFSIATVPGSIEATRASIPLCAALARADVEALALQVYNYRRHRNDPESYWVTSQRVRTYSG